ncbi:MAG: cupin domain-containing protein [Alphaproteobacteria bacterium]|jgi:uncharacterized cupin superfamily protein|nr:DUF861 domain-containing protein [Rhodospirillaceae bacterium]MBT6204203.1 DUF861 domain-containing protein [Rhodospirillaceae bacterium]MBT6512542.1 DUF861 domain-containing protein [Rhodospirillaceae bacterium]MBT7613595.1 DUF861 domain-containing protein [Rhodospirillaceae bacterium]MDG2480536.1 cupin domain-containing protein [Alphaproteobacteria bacterium]
MSTSKVTRFDTGVELQPWPEIPEAACVAGKPVQHGHLYFADDAYGLKIGVWHCTPFTSQEKPHGSTEYCIVMEGSASVIGSDGVEHRAGPGEAIFMPKGSLKTWKQTEDCRKFFFIFEDPSGSETDDPAKLQSRVFEAHGPNGKLDAAPIEDTSFLESAVPTHHNHTYHADPSGQLTSGVWDTTAMTTKSGPFPRHELMSILEGSVTIHEEGVGDHVFNAGDTFLVEKGAMISWQNDTYVRKNYVIFEPDEAMARVADAAE